MKPVVIAVILQALWGLGRSAVKSKLLAVVGIVAVALAFYGLHPLLLLLLAGIATALTKIDFHRAGITVAGPAARFAQLLRTPRALLAAAGAGAASLTLSSLFWVFLKIGSVVFGSGYVLLAFLRTDLVLHRAWLTDSQLLDAVAVGQVTPGPVFTTATFIGYLLARMPGAAVATIGIFLPAFILVAISSPIVFGIRKSKIAGAFLDGVIVASLALMAAVSPGNSPAPPLSTSKLRCSPPFLFSCCFVSASIPLGSFLAAPSSAFSAAASEPRGRRARQRCAPSKSFSSFSFST